MKYILAFLLLLLVISASAADTPVAVVKGTNVLGTAVIDPARFTPPAGASNVVISAAELSIVRSGWRYVAGEFLKPDGKPIANGERAIINRAKLIESAISDLNDMQTQAANALAGWATLTAGQKDNALKRTIQSLSTASQILELLLKEQRSLLEIKPVDVVAVEQK